MAKIISLKRKGVCEGILRKSRLVTEEQLQKAIVKAEETGEYLHQVVVDLDMADRMKVLEVVATELGVKYIDIANEELDSDLVMNTFPRAMEERNKCIPVGKSENTLIIAMADPYNPFALNEIKIRTQSQFIVQQFLAFPRDIKKKLDAVYGKEKEEDLYEALMQGLKYEWGEEIHSQYQLLLTAYNVETVSQIASIASNLQKEVENLKQLKDYILKDSVEALEMLSKVADEMRKYERVGLPEDQVAYLNSSVIQLEQTQRFVQEQLSTPDKRTFEEITTNWRNIIGNSLKVLQSSALLRFELKTKELARLEENVLLLELENVGRGHAENVHVKLIPSEGYELIDEQKEIITILQRRKEEVEFRIRLNLNELSTDGVPQRAGTEAPTLRAVFEIRYDDAQQEGKLEEYADIFSLQMVAEREFRELIPNPYIAGPPLKDSATFFGREDVFEFIVQTLQGQGQRNMIILHGQRRTGKTSIMYQLKHRLGDDFLPVLIDLQGVGYEGIDSLLYAMALNIYRASRERGIEIERPKFEDFSVLPTVQFKYDFLEAVLEKRQGRFLILMIDEFELLEDRVKKGVYDRDIFDYLRNLMQHTEGLGFIFSGSRAIEAMASDYWSVLFNIALYREISSLRREEAERLIREPVSDYFDYDSLAVEKVLRTTEGHPYFTQLFCNILVNYRNERRKNYITIQDVNAVIDEVVQVGRVHLEYLWEESSEAEQLFSILLSMAFQREGLVTLSTLRELVSDFNLHIDLLSEAENLSRRHIIEQEAGYYRFTLELMHHWIRQHKNIVEFLESKGGEVNGNNAKS